MHNLARRIQKRGRFGFYLPRETEQRENAGRMCAAVRYETSTDGEGGDIGERDSSKLTWKKEICKFQ